MTTVTLPSANQILITREFDAPRHLVYRAWTTPDLVRRWWAGRCGQVASVEIDLRVGGAWRYVMLADDGSVAAFGGEYREIVSGERIVYTEVFEDRPDVQALTTVTFTDSGGTTLSILVEYDNTQDRDTHLGYMTDGLEAAMELLEQTALERTTLIYSMSVSLDGFIAGPDGDIAWAAPDEELMRFHKQQSRELAAHLTGRGLYEDMLPWETAETLGLDLEFAEIWKAIPKVVFSTTLDKVEGNARLASGDVVAEVGKLGPGVVSAGGAGLAASLIKMDLIDEYRMFLNPVVLGGGTPWFPPLEKTLNLELIETRTFSSRVVYLRYRRG